MRKSIVLIITLAVSLFLISLVSAYNGGYGGYGGGWGGGWNDWYWGNFTPSMLLENEWFVFGAVFLATFAMTYLGLLKFFHRESHETPDVRSIFFPPKDDKFNNGPIVVISLIVGFFVAAAFSQRAYLYGWWGAELGSWILSIAAIMLILGIIIASFRMTGFVGGVSAIAIILILTALLIDPYETLPYGLAVILGSTLSFIRGLVYFGGPVVIVIGIIFLVALAVMRGKDFLKRKRRGKQKKS